MQNNIGQYYRMYYFPHCDYNFIIIFMLSLTEANIYEELNDVQ